MPFISEDRTVDKAGDRVRLGRLFEGEPHGAYKPDLFPHPLLVSKGLFLYHSNWFDSDADSPEKSEHSFGLVLNSSLFYLMIFS